MILVPPHREKHYLWIYRGDVYNNRCGYWAVKIQMRKPGIPTMFLKRQIKSSFNNREEAESYMKARLEKLQSNSQLSGFTTVQDFNEYLERQRKKHGTSARTHQTSPSVRPPFESRPSKRSQPRVAEPALA